MWLPTRFLFEEVWISSTLVISCHVSQLSNFACWSWSILCIRMMLRIKSWNDTCGQRFVSVGLTLAEASWITDHIVTPPVRIWQKALPRHKTVRTCTENPRWRINQRTIKHKERISKIDDHLFLGIMCRMWHVFLSHGTDSGRISEFVVSIFAKILGVCAYSWCLIMQWWDV